jgi:hypothetical protein
MISDGMAMLNCRECEGGDGGTRSDLGEVFRLSNETFDWSLAHSGFFPAASASCGRRERSVAGHVIWPGGLFFWLTGREGRGSVERERISRRAGKAGDSNNNNNNMTSSQLCTYVVAAAAASNNNSTNNARNRPATNAYLYFGFLPSHRRRLLCMI